VAGVPASECADGGHGVGRPALGRLRDLFQSTNDDTRAIICCALLTGGGPDGSNALCASRDESGRRACRCGSTSLGVSAVVDEAAALSQRAQDG
jgi:hypothetical protein